MYKVSFLIIILSLVILVIGLSINIKQTVPLNESNKHLFLSDSVRENIQKYNGYVFFTIDENVCSVCVTNIHDYTTLLKEYYPAYKAFFLFKINTNFKNVQRFYSMIGENNTKSKIKFDVNLNNIAFREILFTDKDLVIKGERLISGNSVPNLQLKKQIVKKGITLIKN